MSLKKINEKILIMKQILEATSQSNVLHTVDIYVPQQNKQDIISLYQIDLDIIDEITKFFNETSNVTILYQIKEKLDDLFNKLHINLTINSLSESELSYMQHNVRKVPEPLPLPVPESIRPQYMLLQGNSAGMSEIYIQNTTNSISYRLILQGQYLYDSKIYIYNNSNYPFEQFWVYTNGYIKQVIQGGGNDISNLYLFENLNIHTLKYYTDIYLITLIGDKKSNSIKKQIILKNTTNKINKLDKIKVFLKIDFKYKLNNIIKSYLFINFLFLHNKDRFKFFLSLLSN